MILWRDVRVIYFVSVYDTNTIETSFVKKVIIMHVILITSNDIPSRMFKIDKIAYPFVIDNKTGFSGKQKENKHHNAI